MHRDEMLAYLEALEIDAGEAHNLFELLDADMSGDVSIEEFVSGCIRLKGEATAVDVVTLIHENKRLVQLVRDVERKVDNNFELVASRLSDLLTEVTAGVQRIHEAVV